jgi:hypothetical protein
MPRIIQLAPNGGGRYIAVDRDGDLWRGENEALAEGWRGVHRVDAAARTVPEGQLMIAAIYTHGTPRKERERLAEYLK